MGAGARLGTSPGARGRSPRRSARLAWAGACDELRATARKQSRRRRALWSSGWRCPAARCRRAPSSPFRSSRTRRPSCERSSAWERMLADYGSTGVTLREHPLELMRPSLPGGPAHQRGPGAPPGREAGEGGRPGGGPPAPGDRQGGHLHAARGRARHHQPDHPSAGVRALPAGGACRAAAAGHRAASSAARARRTWWWTGSSAWSGPTCRAPRSSTSSRAGRGARDPGGGGLRAVVPGANSFGRRG